MDPWPLSQNESMMLSSTQLMVKGENPYGFESRPAAINVYGILYPLTVAPWALLFRGHELLVHRMLSAIFILGATALIYLASRRAGAFPAMAAFVSLNFYAQQLYRDNALARPDSLGLLLFLGSLFLALLGPPKTSRLIGSALLGAAAFYAKPYFLLALPIVALWLLWKGRLKEALYFSLGSFALMAMSAYLVGRYLPAYFYETFLFEAGYRDYVVSYMLKQLWVIGIRCQPGISLGILALFLLGKRSGPREGSEQEIQEGLCFFALMGMLTFIFLLGGYTSNFGTYFMHLVMPFVLVILGARASGRFTLGALALLVLVNMALLVRERPLLEEMQRRYVDARWARLEHYLEQSHNALTSEDFSALLIEKDRPFENDGPSPNYAKLGGAELKAFDPYFPRRFEGLALYQAQQARQLEGLRKQSYDLVLSCGDPLWQSELGKHYQLLEATDLQYHLGVVRWVEVWVPQAPKKANAKHA
jgi:hypothetical protein